jgi:hypothetical protein
MSTQRIRERSQTLMARRRRRLAIIYASGAGNIGLAIALMWVQAELRLALAYLTVTAIVLMTWTQRRNARRALGPEDASIDGVSFYQRLLERERDFHRDSARWFIIGPALNLVVLGLIYIASPLFHGRPAELLAMAVVAIAHYGVLSLARERLQREARANQHELDALHDRAVHA